MKEFIEVFFRKNEDGFIFNSYSLLHLVLFLIFICVGVMIYGFRKQIRQNKILYKIIKYMLAFLLFFQQISFLYFIFFVRKDGISEGLPLYTCRISIISGIFAILFNLDNLKILTIFWGLIGGIIGLVYPDLMAYSWPHIMYVNFFLTHYLVFWTSIFFLFIDRVEIKKENLKFMFYFVNIFLLVTEIVNLRFNLNYAYLSYSPIFRTRLENLPGSIYFILLVILYNFSIIFNYYIFKKLKLTSWFILLFFVK